MSTTLMNKLINILILNILITSTGYASICKHEDHINFVSSNIGCIGIEQASSILNSKVDNLVVFLHGDSGNVKISNKLLLAANLSGNDSTVSFLMARPGWRTPSGNVSDGGDPEGPDNGDNYIPDRDIDPVAYAITALKEHYNPKKVIVIGFSGGAAITGVIIGRFPGLIDIAVLSSCPCIVPPWREHRMQQKKGIKPSGKIWWPNSHSPHDYVKDITKLTKVILIIGTNDTNTKLEYSEKYFELLKSHNIQSELYLVEDAGHANLRTNEHYVNLLTKIQSDK